MLNENITEYVIPLATNEYNFLPFLCCGHSFVYFNSRIKKHKEFIFSHRRWTKEIKKII